MLLQLWWLYGKTKCLDNSRSFTKINQKEITRMKGEGEVEVGITTRHVICDMWNTKCVLNLSAFIASNTDRCHITSFKSYVNLYMGQTRQEVKRPKKWFFFLDFSLISWHNMNYFEAPDGFYPTKMPKAPIYNVRQVRCTCWTWLKYPPKLGNLSKNDF